MKFDKRAIAVGNFDGVHLGHLHLFKVLEEEAKKRSLVPSALTLEPHPAEVLGGRREFCRLTTAEEKREIIENLLGIHLEVLPFTKDIAELSPEEFVEEVLFKTFNASLIVVGYDWRFGKNASGDYLTVKAVCKHLGCEVIKVNPYTVGGKVVSSTAVRELLRNAKLKEATLYLGRPYWIRRKRQRGLGLASKLGFPTVNLGGVEQLCLPSGVYAVSVEGVPAIAYLGRAPTLKKLGERILEVHLLAEKFEVSETVKVVFHHFLRKEMVFKNAEELAERVRRDIEMAKEYFLIS